MWPGSCHSSFETALSRLLRMRSGTLPVGTAQTRLCPPYIPLPQPFPPTSFANVSRRPMVRLNTGLPGAESLSRTK
jgi:hypothetical protein